MTRPLIAVLDFGSPSMLGWLAAAALPWLINLWMRRRHVEMPWAAVELLLAAVRERSRRLKLRELLLLALRTSILALAALAAARPWWRDAAATNVGKSRTHHVIVIDQSASMACRTGDRTRLDRARERARQIVEESPSGDAFTIIGWSGDADNVLGRPTFDPAPVLAAIDGLQQGDGVAELAPALVATERAIDVATSDFPGLEQVRVSLVSDLGVATWSAALPASMAAETHQLWEELASRGEIVIENVDDGMRDNLAVAEVSLSPSLPTLARPVEARIRAQAHGKHSWRGVRVELLVDGTSVGQQTADVAPDADAVVQFETRLVEAGTYVFEARVDPGNDPAAAAADPLEADNRRWLVADVREAPRVLCLADSAGDATEVARALNPLRGRSAADGGIAVDVGSTTSLAATELAPYDAVFLCNVGAFSPREARLIARYAAEGGAVAVVLGDRVQVENYRESFAAANLGVNGVTEPFLPASPAGPAVAGDWRLDPLEYRHPVVASFAGRSRAGLLGVRVSRYVPLKVDDALGAAAGRTSVALAFSSGDPALVVGDYGLGRVAILATNPALTTDGEPWTTLALSPAFLPLVRELFEHLAAESRAERLNRLVSEPLPMAPTAATSGDDWTTWEGPNREMVASGQATRHHGVYVRRDPDGAQPTSSLVGGRAAIAVNVDPRESDLATVDPGLLKVGVAPSPRSSAGGLLSFTSAVPLDRMLLAAVVALILLELTAAWALGRGWA